MDFLRHSETFLTYREKTHYFGLILLRIDEKIRNFVQNASKMEFSLATREINSFFVGDFKGLTISHQLRAKFWGKVR